MRIIAGPINARRRLLAAAMTVTAALGGLVGATAPASANVNTNPGPYCSDNGDQTPCILSASVQTGAGAPEAITAASPDYGVGIDACPVGVTPDPDGGCQGSVGWAAYSSTGSGPGSFQADQTWTITLDLGEFIPSGTDTWGTDMTVDRVDHPSLHARVKHDYRVTLTGQPSLLDDGSSCTEGPNATFLCGEQASETSLSLFGFVNNDYSNLNATEAAAAYGTDTWTTSSATGAPLFLGSTADGVITIPIGNVHRHADGTLVHGQYQAVLPNTLLQYIGIDDPSTITPGSLAVSLSSGNVSITPGPDGVTISLSNIIWPEPPGGHTAHLRGAASKKAKNPPIKIRPGVITPTRLTKVKAHRSSPQTGKISVSGARARGSKIVKYTAMCSAKHQPSRSGTSKSKKHLVVHGLTAGKSYSCKARAVAKAGHGHWSKSVTLHRH